MDISATGETIFCWNLQSLPSHACSAQTKNVCHKGPVFHKVLTWHHIIMSNCDWSGTRYWQFDGILPKGPYLLCVSMAGRALLAGYHWVLHALMVMWVVYWVHLIDSWTMLINCCGAVGHTMILNWSKLFMQLGILGTDAGIKMFKFREVLYTWLCEWALYLQFCHMMS